MSKNPFAFPFETPELDPEYLDPILEGLVQMNLVWLARNRDTAPGPLYSLYPNRMRYFEHPAWYSIPTALRRKQIDCKGAAAWRAAELRFYCGEWARPVAEYTSIPDLIHVVVKRADGRREDPSLPLGMREYFARKKLGLPVLA